MSSAAAFTAIAPSPAPAAPGAVAANAPGQAFSHALNTVLATQGAPGQGVLGQGVLGQGTQTPGTQAGVAQGQNFQTTLQRPGSTDHHSFLKQLADAKTLAGQGQTAQNQTTQSQTAQTSTQTTGQAAAQASTALAASQGILPSSQVSASTTVSLNDLLKQAATGASTATPGADQARLATLTQKLNKLEAQATGVDPSAPPAGWTEPQVFAQARALLNKTFGGATATGTASTSNPLATAGMPIAGQPAAQTPQARAQSQAQADQAAAGSQASAASQAAQAGTTVTPPAATKPLQAADSGQTAPLTAPAQSQGDAKTASADSHSLTSPSDIQHAAAAVATQTAQVVPALHDKSAGHDTLDSDSSDQAPADAATTPDASKSADANSNISANNVQTQTQAAATAAATVNDPAHAAPQATAYLAAQMVKGLSGKASQFDIELHPADLGRVDVQMRIEQDGRLNATLAFDNPAAAAEFRARSGELRQQLQQAGFQVSDDSLNFTDRNTQGFGQQASQSFDQNSGSSSSWDNSTSRARAFQNSSVNAQVADATLASSSRSALRGLDMRV